MMITLPVFSADEAKRAKILLATRVAAMMGRKLEEGDWGSVYGSSRGGGWVPRHFLKTQNYKKNSYLYSIVPVVNKRSPTPTPLPLEGPCAFFRFVSRPDRAGSE